MFSIFKSKGKLTDLDCDRKRFLAAHLLLVTKLNEELFQRSNREEYNNLQITIAQSVRNLVGVGEDEINDTLVAIDSKINNQNYPLVFGISSEEIPVIQYVRESETSNNQGVNSNINYSDDIVPFS